LRRVRSLRAAVTVDLLLTEGEAGSPAGKIVGYGAKVVWDLTGVKAGTYTITAAANDGCGLCGKFVTKTVVVKD
jgi:hypothetical protein